ncbi:hypothetical protein LOZ53_003722 [Ophidiomyces ophidiicola]|nr:hypothetical protein LOZ55_005424 [Ophidiomyces ophidiicola]KAI1977144.1 hypothetical protein LOZ54_006533 [Ophidiomyces ophidiicola]KAI1986734.1 hypothetical protein LOZ51_005894 [Ophidiomyces ophidiicola]KAI1989045.1 hypothetical protein LOZ53_003722 [Ophidiomyces ophidiicola]
MAGYQPDYLQNERTRTGSGSPLSPLSPSQPPSFKANINRMKTKRWVNAKTYTYDGDDWGESGDEMYDEDSRQFPPPHPPGNPVVLEDTSATQHRDPLTATAAQNTLSQETNSAGPPPFIRPADIYKRMTKEREKQQTTPSKTAGSVPSDQPSNALPDQKAHLHPNQDMQSKDSRSDLGSITSDLVDAKDSQENQRQHLGKSMQPVQYDTGLPASNTIFHSQLPHSVAKGDDPVKLPELKPFSNFGDGLIDSSNRPPVEVSNAINTNNKQSKQPPGVERDPSVDFRPAVNQALEAPNTPSTQQESVTSPSSNTTSIITPIIHSDNTTSQQTPTFHGDSVSEATDIISPHPTQMVSNLKPGHRRSLSPTGQDNSPGRQPVVMMEVPVLHSEPTLTTNFASELHPTNNQQTGPNAAQGEQSATGILRPSTIEIKEDDIKATTSVNKAVDINTTQLNTEGSQTLAAVSDSNAQFPLSATRSVVNTSSTNDLNDRLRDEIIRSLTPAPPNQPSDSIDNIGGDLESRSRIRHESNLVPNEYDYYWGERSDRITSSLPLSLAIPQDTSLSNASKARPPSLLDQNSTDIPQPLGRNRDSICSPQQPALKKKFSWESDSDGGDSRTPAPLREPDQQPTDIASPRDPSETIRKVDDTVDSTSSPIPPLKRASSPVLSPILCETPSVVAHESTGETELPSKNTLPNAPLLHENNFMSEPLPSRDSVEQVDSPSMAETAGILGFREIMAMTTTSQKISAFDRAREQFATSDTGLQDWLNQTVESLSEHADLIQHNGALPPGSIASQRPIPRAKFSRLPSLHLTSQEGPTASRTHMRHSSTPLSSMIHTQQVQAKGKDLLHSAGVLGGKAGGAAKGLFAKGRNRFRHSGSADKVDA